ncbi:hypothetical protein [Thiohalophilus sp.]|nr:hypothetical protein [Thiohalophilus sp.]MDZ7802357.1 hypothetical protein [Thiohalophilus sp.]
MQTQEVLNEEMNHWEYLAFRAAETSAEQKDLFHSTRRQIALTYIHKLVS